MSETLPMTCRRMVADNDNYGYGLNKGSKSVLSACADEIDTLEARVKELEREADVAKQRLRDNYDISVGQYWSWQGDGEDHLESLTCPIVIQPETMRNLLQSAKQLAEMVDTVIYSGIGNDNIHITAPDAKKLKAKASEVLEKIK